MSGLFQWEPVAEDPDDDPDRDSDDARDGADSADTADTSAGELTDPARRRRVRALVIGCVLGAVVIVVVAVLGTLVLSRELDKHDRSKADVIRATYATTYQRCRADGGVESRCEQQASRACVADDRWRDSDPPEDLVRACDFSRGAR